MSEHFYRVSKEELNEIYKFHYNYTSDKRSKYVWDWEYGTQNPNNSLLLAVKDKDKVVATQGILEIKIAFGNEIKNTGKNESLLIDTDYRGKSLSTRFYVFAINEYKKERISCLWGFSRKAVIPLKKAKFQVFENIIKQMVLATDFQQSKEIISKFAEKGIKGFLLILALKLATIYSSVLKRISTLFAWKQSGSKELCQNLKSPNDLIKLYEHLRIANADLIYIYQDADYFNWRIQKSPLPIQTLFLYENNILKGYIYLTMRNKLCEITDFTFSDKQSGKYLLHELIKIINKNNLGFVYYTGNNNNELNLKVFNLLKRFGFLKIKGRNHFVIRNFKFKDEKKLFNIKNWYLNDLWSEGI